MVTITYMAGTDLRTACFMTDSVSVAMDEFYSFHGDFDIVDVVVA